MSKEYKLIVADVRGFEAQVNRALELGWELQGIPFYDGSRFLQAMLRDKKPTKKEKYWSGDTGE